MYNTTDDATFRKTFQTGGLSVDYKVHRGRRDVLDVVLTVLDIIDRHLRLHFRFESMVQATITRRL